MAQNMRTEVEVGNENLKTASTTLLHNSPHASAGTNKFEDLQFRPKLKARGRLKLAEKQLHLFVKTSADR